jgi:hypothetical protein
VRLNGVLDLVPVQIIKLPSNGADSHEFFHSKLGIMNSVIKIYHEMYV